MGKSKQVIGKSHNYPSGWNSYSTIPKGIGIISLLYLMRAIAHAHASTCTTSLMHAKNSTCHSCLWHSLSGTMEWKKWNKDQKHQIK